MTRHPAPPAPWVRASPDTWRLEYAAGIVVTGTASSSALFPIEIRVRVGEVELPPRLIGDWRHAEAAIEAAQQGANDRFLDGR